MKTCSNTSLLTKMKETCIHIATLFLSHDWKSQHQRSKIRQLITSQKNWELFHCTYFSFKSWSHTEEHIDYYEISLFGELWEIKCDIWTCPFHKKEKAFKVHIRELNQRWLNPNVILSLHHVLALVRWESFFSRSQ